MSQSTDVSEREEYGGQLSPEDREMANTPTASVNGVCAKIGALPPGALVTEKGLATMMGKSAKSIRRAVARGELPPPVRLMGQLSWTAGAIVRHIEKRLEVAAREAERESLRIEGFRP